ERVAGIELGHAVGAHNLPIGATRQNASTNPGPLERATQDRDNAAAALRQGTNIQRRADLRASLQNQDQFRCHLDVLVNSPNSPPSELLFFSTSPPWTPRRSTTWVRLLPKAVLEGTGFPSISA